MGAEQRVTEIDQTPVVLPHHHPTDEAARERLARADQQEKLE